MKKQPNKAQKSNVVTETNTKPEFNPLLSEVVPDDSFSFTLLACHCSASAYTPN